MTARLGLGCAPLGNLYAPISEADAHDVVAAALDEGIRFFDTAPLYGHGLSEQRLGAALNDGPVERHRLTIATKVGRLLVRDSGGEATSIFASVPPVHPVFDFSAEATLRSVEQSLTRMGVDRVDILHVHDPDDHVAEALAGAFPALRRLRDEGVVAAIGAGMNESAVLTRFVEEAGVDCVLVAGRYSLLDQSALADLLPAAANAGVDVFVGGVFNSGVLADPDGNAHYDYAPASAEVIARVRRLAAVCRDHDVPLTAAAMQFPFGHPAVARVLVGAHSAEEVHSNAAAFRQDVPPQLWRELVRLGLLPDDVPLPA